MSDKMRGGLLSSILQLGKIKISIPVALTGYLGYLRASGEFNEVFLFTFFGIFFMSMGSSTFNQVQERNTDKRMKRTADRPLPAGRISLAAAIVSGILFSAAGLALLLFTGKPLAALIGLVTLGWYNLVYTPLKRFTPFAVVPGAIIGALPPLIGWAAAGGNIIDREILLISFFLFIGQMPHYWLLLIKIGDEFREAGLPVITEIFSAGQLRSISFAWIIAAAASVVIFPVTGIMHVRWMGILILSGVVIFLIILMIHTFRGDLTRKWRFSFVAVNLFYLFIILALIGDKLIEMYLYV